MKGFRAYLPCSERKTINIVKTENVFSEFLATIW